MAVLFAAIFVFRYLFGTPGDGLTFLYLLPICLVANERGTRAGVVAGLLALVLFAIWDRLDSQFVPPLGYGTRALVFVGVGALCGSLATRARRVGEESDRYFELSSQMLGIFTFDGRPTRLNGRWTEVLGWSREQFMSADMSQVVHPEDLSFAGSKLAETVGGGGEVHFTIRMLTAQGAVRNVAWTSTVDAEEGLIYTAAQDVTQRHQLENARRQAEERFRVAFEDSATGMAVVALTAERNGQIVEANAELARILGAPRQQLLGMSGLMDFAHPDDTAWLREELGGMADGEDHVVRSEIRIVRPDGGACWVHLTSSLLHGEDGQPLFRLTQIMDIDARKRANAQLQHMADHDPLSWLFNRRRFLDELDTELSTSRSRGSRGAVLAIDLDGFKQVNDLAGHAVGDEVIKTVALALVRRLRSGDAAGRMGGDEFGVLLRRVTPEEAILVSHDLLEAVSEALGYLDDDVARRVTMSIGVAVVDGTESSADILLERADAAMYEAKRDGGGRVALSASVLARA